MTGGKQFADTSDAPGWYHYRDGEFPFSVVECRLPGDGEESMQATCSATAARSILRNIEGLGLGEISLPHRRTFYPLGYPVEIETNELEVFVMAKESFGHMQASRKSTRLRVPMVVTHREGAISPPEPARHFFNQLFSLVADVDNQSLLNLQSGANCTWVTQAALKNQLYFRNSFLEKVVYLLLGSSVVTDLHAACVSKNGKGILLCGRSGAGKSTLAYACARAGWTYTSDDTSYLINEATIPRVIGHCHRARFRPAARDLFPELEGRGITPRMEGKPSIEIPIAELPVKHTAVEADIHAVVFLERHNYTECNLIRQEQGTAPKKMQQEIHSTGAIRDLHVQRLTALWNTPAYDLRYCRLRDAVEALDLLTLQI